jgi:hypothetical protein
MNRVVSLACSQGDNKVEENKCGQPIVEGQNMYYSHFSDSICKTESDVSGIHVDR